jgi:hypothetical protein
MLNRAILSHRSLAPIRSCDFQSDIAGLSPPIAQALEQRARRTRENLGGECAILPEQRANREWR